jgi:LysM repeat protein
MRVWINSACVVLAWGSILVIVVVTTGISQPVHPAQANIRIASSTTEVTNVSAISVAAVFVKTAHPAARYAVQPGDSLSSIAERLAVRGGWQALYAANRSRIGPDPDVIHPGTVLVVPGKAALTRYTVAAGDTLTAIAAALAVRGGWQALYAANRSRIGSDPDVIRPGTVLAVPGPKAPQASVSSPGRPASSAPRSAPAGGHRPLPAGSGQRSLPGGTGTPATDGMPGWLKTMLLAAGLIVGAAYLTEPMLLMLRRRRRQAPVQAAAVPGQTREPVLVPRPRDSREPAAGHPAAEKSRIMLADYDRVVVTQARCDGMVYVLRPPGEDPRVILRAARLILREDPYEELAEQLGVPAGLPMG